MKGRLPRLGACLVACLFGLLACQSAVPGQSRRAASPSPAPARAAASPSPGSPRPAVIFGPAQAGYLLLARAADPACGSADHHLTTRCTLSAQVLNQSGPNTVRIAFVLPTAQYQMTKRPPYEVVMKSGPKASCVVAAVAVPRQQQRVVQCEIVAPANFGFPSPAVPQVVITPV